MLVAGAVADKSTRLVGAGDPVVVSDGPPRFVSRGGEKLDAALDRFGIEVRDRTALDAGASTGGFTDCLLQRGARRVVAVDVGHGQLDPKLRRDPRVEVLERTNVRDLLGPSGPSGPPANPRQAAPPVAPVDLVTADLSFISLTTVAPQLVGSVLTRPGDAVVLVKPQFEVGRRIASKGRGVVRDPTEWAGALRRVCAAFAEAGAPAVEAMVSPLRGRAGNVEFLVHLATGEDHPGGGVDPRAASSPDRSSDTRSALEALVDQVVAEVSAGGPAEDPNDDGRLRT